MTLTEAKASRRFVFLRIFFVFFFLHRTNEPHHRKVPVSFDTIQKNKKIKIKPTET